MKIKLKILTAAAFKLIVTINSFGQNTSNQIIEQRLTIVTLGVNNLKKSTEFYESSFGWKRLSSSNENIVFFYLNGFQLALFDKNELAKDAGVANDGIGFKGVTISYNTRSLTEVDDIIKRLRAKGVKIIKEPTTVFWGGYSSYISDLDGNLWEIAFNPYLQLDAKGNVNLD